MKYQRARHFKQWRPWWWPKTGQSRGDVQAAFLHELATAKDISIFDKPGSSTHQAWLGIISMWQSGWWTRTWVFQEATIPEKFRAFYVIPLNTTATIPSKVKFLLGDQQTDWQRLHTSLVSVADHISRMPEIDSNLFQGKRAAYARVQAIRSWRIIEDVPSPLEIMQCFRLTDCYDPRDKVYAPLCLAQEDIRHEISPDYKHKTASELYTDIVRYHLAQDASNLDFLGYVMHQEGSSVLQTPGGVVSTVPSWVPNFFTQVGASSPYLRLCTYQ